MMKRTLLFVLAFAGICTLGVSQDITGTIWEDMDGDGMFTAGDGLDDVTVTLINCDTGVAIAGFTTETNVDGEYSFSGVPTGGPYCIQIDENDPDLPAGFDWCSTEPGSANPEDSEGDANQTGNLINAGQADEFMVPGDVPFQLDLGIYTLLQIQGDIFEDLNNNGVEDGDEENWPECVDVTLYNSNGSIAENCSGFDLVVTVNPGVGAYTFNDVPPGDYYVVFDNLCPIDCGATSYTTNYSFSAGGAVDANTDDNDVDESNGTGSTPTFSLTSQGADIEVDAGLFGYLLSTISGDIFEDLNDDGLNNAGTDIEVTTCLTVCVIDNNTGNPATDCDGAQLCQDLPAMHDGTYEFLDNVPPGEYYMEFSDWCNLNCDVVPELAMSDTGPVEDFTNDNDANNDEGGTPPTFSTPVFMVNGGAPSTWTNETWDVDAGVTGVVLSTIEGEIYEDFNNDGLFAGADALVSCDIEVCIYDNDTGGVAVDCDGNDLCVTTSSGSYQFGNNVPPGDYYVQFDASGCDLCFGSAYAGFSEGGDVDQFSNDNDADGSNGGGEGMDFSTTPVFTVENGDPPLEVDMGVFGTATISGETWEDINGNGTQDAGDGVIDVGDVCIWLVEGGATTDVLDVLGNSLGAPLCITGTSSFTFNDLPPGEYKIVFPDAPNSGGVDYHLTTNWAGVGSDPLASDTDSDACPPMCSPENGCTNNIIVESCQEAEDVEAGYYQAANVHGFVFKDADADDCFGGPDMLWDAVPFAVPAITVSISLGGAAVTDVFGNNVAAITVDGSTAGGEYCFENLPPGENYVVNFSDPGAPWEISQLNINVDPTTTTGCNDADPDTGDTAEITIESGDLTDCTSEVNFGLYKLLSIGGVVFDDADEDCIFADGVETGFADIEVTVQGDCSNGLTFGPMTVTTEMITGAWSIDDMIPPCDCIMVYIDAGMFDVSTGPLGNHVTCGSASATDENNAGGVTNNGSDPGPDSEADCVEMICGLLPDMDGMAQLTIDFGFFFECNNATTPIYPTCEESGEQDECNSFNYICDVENLNNFCGTMPPPPNATGPGTLCSNGGVPHNTTWVSFIAGADAANFYLEIFVTGCTGASGAEGLQWGIVESCSFEEVICDGNCTAAGTIVIDINNPPAGSGELVPGQQYYFWLDGCNGSVCDFEMNLVSGGGTYNFPFVEVSDCVDCLDTSDPPAHEYDLCTGAVGMEFCINSASGEYDDLALEYYWNIDDVIDGVASNTTADDANLGFTEENCIVLDFDEATYPPGQYELCMVYLGTCCDNEGPLCMTITIADPLPQNYAPIDVCLNDLVGADYMIPAVDINGNTLNPWFGALPIDPMDIDDADDYGGVIPNQPLGGCEIEQTVTITDLPIPVIIWQDVVCSSDLEPGGIYENGYIIGNGMNPIGTPSDEFFTVNNFPVNNEQFVFEDGSASPLDYAMSGCDLTVVAQIELIEVLGTLTQEPCDQNFGVLLEWENEGPDLFDYQNVTFTWYEEEIDPANILLDADGIIEDNFVYASGLYILEICAELDYINPADHDDMPTKQCCFPFEIEVTLNDPDPPVIVGELSLCEPNTTQTYSIDPSYESGGLIQWSTSAGVINSGFGTSEIEINWENTTGGLIYVLVGGLCGSADDEAIVEVFTQPVASIAPAGPVCIDQPTDIVFDGTPSATLTYTWNIGAGVEQSGSGLIGPGPHAVQWATPGMKEVTLITQEGTCPSEEVSIMVEVLEPIPAPTIQCAGGTTDELTFCWNDVGADEYIPTIISQTGSGVINYVAGEFCLTVAGLNVTEDVEIQIEAVDNGVCFNVLSLPQICTVQNCPIPTLSIDCMIPDICLTAGVAAVDLSSCVSADLPGNGTYSGAGVTGTSFDPSDPAVIAGDNTISYDYITDLMCTNSTSFTITVNPLPIAEFTVESPICISAASMVEFSGADLPDGGFVWDTGGANETGITGAGPHNLTFPDVGTYTISLVTTDGGCESVMATMQIVVEDQVPAPVVSCLNQTTSSVEFGWTEEPGVTYQVNEVNVPANGSVASSAGNYLVTDLLEDQEVIIEVVAISDNSCPNATTEWMCTAIACLTASINLGPDRLECFDGAPFTLMAASNNPQVELALADSFTWSINTPNGMGVDQTGTVDPTIAGPGVWTVTLDFTIGDCDYSDDMEVEVLGPGTVTLTPDFPICVEEAPVQLDGEVTDVVLDNPVATWSGNGVDANSGMFDPAAASIGPNVITYTVNDDTGCEYSGTMTVTVEESIVGPSTSCVSTLDQIAFLWEGDDVPCAEDWIVVATSGGVVLPGTQIGNSYLVENLTEGQEVEFSLEMVSSTCLCPFSMSESCVAEDCPPVTLELEEHPVEICEGEDLVAYQIGVIITGSVETGDGVWTGTGVTADGMFDPSIGVGSYDLLYTYTESGCPFPIMTTINIFEDPTALIDVTDPPCPEDNMGSITIDVLTGMEPLTITVNGDQVVADEFIELAPGTYEIFISDANMCSYTETVTINAALEQSVEIIGELNGVFPESLDFTFETSVPMDLINSITWTLDSLVICNECDMVTLDSLINNEQLCVQLVYNDACTIDTCVPVSIIQLTQIYFPNIITPNDDGYNDEWIIGSNAIESIQYVNIYDRWGELILSLDEDSVDAAGNPILQLDGNNEVRVWDGTFKSKDVVNGVYVFVMEYTDTKGIDGLIETGDITVVK